MGERVAAYSRGRLGDSSTPSTRRLHAMDATRSTRPAGRAVTDGRARLSEGATTLKGRRPQTTSTICGSNARFAQGGLPISGTWPFRSRPCNDKIALWHAFWSILSKSRFVSQDTCKNENCFHFTK